LAKYKSLPNYEIIRPKLHVQFNSEGVYETKNEKEIAFLDANAPFIERLDKAEVKQAEKVEEKIEEKPAPKKAPAKNKSAKK
jgi:hypothetical protein